MLYHAKNGKLQLDNTTIDYIQFGQGQEVLIMIPGLGDGLKTVRGLALPLAHMHKIFAKDFTVYIFGRRNQFPEDFSTVNMADDIAKTMELLKLEKAHLLGISQGGMIAQCIAIKYPQKVKKLVLTVTSSKPNDILKSTINAWMEKAIQKDYQKIFKDIVKRSYTEPNLKKYKNLYNLASYMIKPKENIRFIIEAKACLTHDAYEELEKIKSPTLIIGASDDTVVGVNASYEIAERIKNSKLYIYEGYKHGVYQEVSNFDKVVYNYLKNK